MSKKELKLKQGNYLSVWIFIKNIQNSSDHTYL